MKKPTIFLGLLLILTAILSRDYVKGANAAPPITVQLVTVNKTLIKVDDPFEITVRVTADVELVQNHGCSFQAGAVGTDIKPPPLGTLSITPKLSGSLNGLKAGETKDFIFTGKYSDIPASELPATFRIRFDIAQIGSEFDTEGDPKISQEIAIR